MIWDGDKKIQTLPKNSSQKLSPRVPSLGRPCFSLIGKRQKKKKKTPSSFFFKPCKTYASDRKQAQSSYLHYSSNLFKQITAPNLLWKCPDRHTGLLCPFYTYRRSTITIECLLSTADGRWRMRFFLQGMESVLKKYWETSELQIEGSKSQCWNGRVKIRTLGRPKP